MTGTVHIIGAGLAGLSCAVTAAHAGRKVVLYEATKSAGGRCRSFYDPTLGTVVDNGSHAVLGANPAVHEYLKLTGATEELVSINPKGNIPFVDLESDTRWDLDPGKTRIPWWVFRQEKRPPETNLAGFLKGLRLLVAAQDKSVSDVIPPNSQTSQRFWEPFSTAVMNTCSMEASASLLGHALRQAMSTKGGGFQAYVPKTSLADTFVNPALRFLDEHNSDIRFESATKSIAGGSRATLICLRSSEQPIGPDDTVVIAVPPWSPLAQPFLGTALTPRPSPIVNVHYRTGTGGDLPPMTGVIGGTVEWIFVRDDLVSVTVSAATEIASLDQDEIARVLWADVRKALNLRDDQLPPYRVIVERRATPIQDCAFAASRPEPQTHLSNVFLAGDWLNTGLPCTLESAVLSGKSAARHALQYR